VCLLPFLQIRRVSTLWVWGASYNLPIKIWGKIKLTNNFNAFLSLNDFSDAISGTAASNSKSPFPHFWDKVTGALALNFDGYMSRVPPSPVDWRLRCYTGHSSIIAARLDVGCRGDGAGQRGVGTSWSRWRRWTDAVLCACDCEWWDSMTDWTLCRTDDTRTASPLHVMKIHWQLDTWR